MSPFPSILKTPEVTKIIQGEKLPTESKWADNPWLMPAVHMYGRLAYKFEGMTDMINCAFMEDLSELLNAATGDHRRRKSFYEIDTEFEKMKASLLKNFSSMASLMPFLRASLRQTMMRRLDDDHPFIVLTETKFSFRCIPVWIGTLLTGLGSKKNTCDNVLTMTSKVPW